MDGIIGYLSSVENLHNHDPELPVSNESKKVLAYSIFICVLAISLTGKLFSTYTDADLPYWDNTTSILSILAIWLQGRKKIECWIILVDD